ncbi:MAG: hypothetical protein KAS75_05965 [Planctomycetes bacterium]|nr:hypothetical protein [Planctomycetota bacterium]
MDTVCKKYFTKTALIWAACFVLFFLVHIFVMAPQKKNKEEIGRQFIEKKRMYEFAIKATQEGTREKLNRQIEELRSKLGDFVINYEDSANMTLDIRQIATEKQIASFTIKNQTNQANSPLAKCRFIDESRFNISFNAGFNQFATFLNTLERRQPVVFVDKFKITRNDDNSQEHRVNMSLAFFVKKKLSG